MKCHKNEMQKFFLSCFSVVFFLCACTADNFESSKVDTPSLSPGDDDPGIPDSGGGEDSGGGGDNGGDNANPPNSGGGSTTPSWISSFDDYQTPITNASPTALVAYFGQDAVGNLYLSGTADHTWVMLKSSDEGATWSQEFSQSPNGLGYRMAFDSLGNIFASGAYSVSVFGQYHGRIKRFSASSQTWSDVYTSQIETGKNTSFQGIAIDAADNIYAVGGAEITLLSPDGYPDRSVTQWVVIKSTDQGASWNLVDQYYLNDHTSTYATDILLINA